jgi:hypothetical protein
LSRGPCGYLDTNPLTQGDVKRSLFQVTEHAELAGRGACIVGHRRRRHPTWYAGEDTARPSDAGN